LGLVSSSYVKFIETVMLNETLIESVDTFKVHFGGLHVIDAELFTKVINNTIDLVKASANAIDPNCFLRLEIKANKEGSFETIIDAVVKYSETLFAQANVSLAGNIVQGFLNFLLIKEHLNGRKAKRVETKDDVTAIENQDGKVIKVDAHSSSAFFQNAKIDNSIIQIFGDLNEGQRSDFSIERNEKKISFNQNIYNKMQEKIVDEKNITSRVERQRPIAVELLLKKPDLLGDSAWQFVYNKNISARIEDKEFLNKVHTRKIKTLYAGVKIPCLLEIEYELDDKLNPVLNSDKYTIIKITGDIIEPVEFESLDMFSEDV
jgi:hypothetical protein